MVGGECDDVVYGENYCVVWLVDGVVEGVGVGVVEIGDNVD